VHLKVPRHGQPHAYDGVLLSDLPGKVDAPRGQGIRGREPATVVR
jgi:hypothetical protein